MKQGKYKICKRCIKPINRGGVKVSKKVGVGWSHNPSFYHKNCWRLDEKILTPKTLW